MCLDVAKKNHEISETFYYFLEVGLRKTTERTEDTEKKATLCALRVLRG